MESVLRAIFIYFFLLILMRISGRHTFSQLTAFDFIFLLIIGETTQQALLGEDYSITNAAVVILSLVGVDMLLAKLTATSKNLSTVIDGDPIVLVDNGKVLDDRLKKNRIDKAEILTAAREQCGLGSMDKIRYAVLEASGGISIIPNKEQE